jgi:hypothetical protein
LVNFVPKNAGAMKILDNRAALSLKPFATLPAVLNILKLGVHSTLNELIS